MPLSAADLISEANGSLFHSMAARAIGSLWTPGSGGTENVAGYMLSRGKALQPLLTSGLGMLGLDPMSLGMKAGMGVWNRGGGLMASAAAGLGVMGGAQVLGTGLEYATNQMLQGASQQMNLSNTLRSNFNFINQQGTKGFTTGQSQQIGDFLRGMTHDIGPGGEMHSFTELSKLASNMGRMGMAQDVRTAKDFKLKFKEMTDTLKQIATDMGASLEEAQKAMQAMKGSGIFNKVDQLRMSRGTRITALAGNLAHSEVSSMANIGSQITRAIGGLGRQGAMAGMQTIGQIGVSQQLGAISEEDIYNATGLLGAEGRQALATAQLQQSASFLSTGRGRRFMASMADRDGKLNDKAVAEWMAGGVSTDRTNELVGEGIGRTGRANFIRNEGRLRGSVLEKFGGLAQSMAYQQWLASRGYDAHKMDDVSMLAFQRFSNMGRDEAEIAVKQIQSLPETLEKMRDTERLTDFNDSQLRSSHKSGLSGLKHKVQKFKESVNGSLQKTGSSLLEWAESKVEKVFNLATDRFHEQATEGIHEVERGLKWGGEGARDQYRRFFGGGQITADTLRSGINSIDSGIGEFASKSSRLQNLSMSAITGMSRASTESIEFARENKEFLNELALGLKNMDSKASINAFGEKLAKKGFSNKFAAGLADKFKDMSEADQVGTMQAMMSEAGVHDNFTILKTLEDEKHQVYKRKKGYRSAYDKYEELGYAMTGKSPVAEEKYVKGSFLSDAEQMLKVDPLKSMSTSDGKGQLFDSLASKWNSVRNTSASDVMSGVVSNIGLFSIGKRLGGIFDSGLESAGLGKDHWSRQLTGLMQAPGDWLGKKAGQGLDAVTDLVSGNGWYGTKKFFGMTDEYDEAKHARTIGKMLEDPGNLSTLADLHSGDVKLEAGARLQLTKEMQNLRDKEHMTQEDRSKLSFFAASHLGSKYKGNLDKADLASEFSDLTGELVTDPHEILSMIRASSTVGSIQVGKQQQEDVMQSMKRISHEKNYESKRMQQMMGLVTDKEGKLQLDVSNIHNVGKYQNMSEGEWKAMDLGMGLVNHDLSGKDLTGDQISELMGGFGKSMGIVNRKWEHLSKEEQAAYRQNAAHRGYFKKHENLREGLSSMSEAELKKIASSQAGTVSGDAASAQIALTRKFDSLTQATGSDVGALGKMLGLNLPEEELKNIVNGRDKGQSIQLMLERAGIKDDDKLKESLTSALQDKSSIQLPGMFGGGSVDVERGSGRKAFSVKQALENMSESSKKALQEKSAESSDPNFRELKKMNETITRSNDYLKVIAQHKGIEQGVLDKIAGKAAPEDKKAK